MATTGVREYASTGNFSVLTRHAWSNKLHKQVQDKLYFNKKGFIGPDMGDEDALDKVTAWYPVVQKTELGKEGGDRITMPLLRQLVALKTTGNTALKDTTGNSTTAGEEPLDFWSFNAWIELMRHATGWQHKMSPQRNKFHSKETVAGLLSDWLAQEMDDSIFNTFYNRYSDHVITETAAASTAHPNLFFGGDATDEDGVDSADVFDTSVLERMAVWAEDNNINPVRMANGEEGFIAIIHPYQMYTLRDDDRWINANQHGNHRGLENPIFSGSEGKWAGIYCHVTRKIATPASSVADYTNKRKTILMGAHSVARAMGQRPQLIKRDDTDYGRISNWAIDVIFGDARADWGSDDGNSTTSNQSSSIWTTYAANPVS